MDARQEAFGYLDQVVLFSPVSVFTSIFRAFDDCAVTESIFKLLHIFGNLVQRNLIALELSDKMPLLITTLDKEMDDARKIFMKQQVLNALHENLSGFVYLILSCISVRLLNLGSQGRKGTCLWWQDN